jgi:hypothetical protein
MIETNTRVHQNDCHIERYGYFATASVVRDR